MGELTAYGSLFAAAFIAATLLPAQSEAVMVGLLLTGDYSPMLLVLVASVGNVGGAVLNWTLGRAVERFRGRRWFPVPDKALDRAQAWFTRFGIWSLLLSWLPIGGGALTVVAGVLRVPFWRFVVLVALGKVGRYVVLALVTLRLA
ncbi:YqaA family protein [Pararoseomonas sp. SCSIO 73927]|uniref:YqaA family protein n=1 Tax=Pararoseomonas sp. SCSIO 73927 TaxID=3114537 RepID=UPI0030CC677C